jgi:hypothetical protein
VLGQEPPPVIADRGLGLRAVESAVISGRRAGCLRAVVAIVETARAGTGVGSILNELEGVRPMETARDRPRNGDEVIAQVIELAWSTDEWLLRGN